MRCGRCGAALREGAQFCNSCGARVSPDEGREVPGDRNQRPSRPSRPLRASIGDERGPAPVSRPLYESDDGFGAASRASRPLGRETTTLGERAAMEASTQQAGTQSGEDNRAVADLPTSEYPSLTPVSGSRVADALSGPAPWPLPVGVALEGRYQIAEVVSVEEEGPAAENVYHVVDLRGYERCWSCKTEYGPGSAGERFCPQCGADMLDHLYLMTERRNETDADTRPGLPALDEGQDASADAGRAFIANGRRYLVTEIVREVSPFPYGPHVSVAGLAHVGQTRAGETNEDSFGSLVINLSHDSRRLPLAFAIVADGLGGHASGQDASRLVTRLVIERLTTLLGLPLVAPLGVSLPPDEVVESALREVVMVANDAVYQANVQGAGDMGSTLVAAVIVGETAWIANVGDSRAYALDADSLRRVTSDHSLVEQLILSGMIEPEERYSHPQRNRIFRSLGGGPTVEVDIYTQRLRPGMRLLLCSDGLWEMTRDDELERILRAETDPFKACQALIESANRNGGEDNITAVVAQVEG